MNFVAFCTESGGREVLPWASLQCSPSLALTEVFLTHKSPVSRHSQWLLALPRLGGFRGFWLSDVRDESHRISAHILSFIFAWRTPRICLLILKFGQPQDPLSCLLLLFLCTCVALIVACLEAVAQCLLRRLAKGALWPTNARDDPGQPFPHSSRGFGYTTPGEWVPFGYLFV